MFASLRKATAALPPAFASPANTTLLYVEKLYDALKACIVCTLCCCLYRDRTKALVERIGGQSSAETCDHALGSALDIVALIMLFTIIGSGPFFFNFLMIGFVDWIHDGRVDSMWVDCLMAILLTLMPMLCCPPGLAILWYTRNHFPDAFNEGNAALLSNSDTEQGIALESR
mmetsp:Transcript_36658/g.67204  ORF Transcript_36658/g.67204 Transcript_36658/m.67204 type:complete len:172 (+) Transcript_36658:41-556(+)